METAKEPDGGTVKPRRQAIAEQVQFQLIDLKLMVNIMNSCNVCHPCDLKDVLTNIYGLMVSCGWGCSQESAFAL